MVAAGYFGLACSSSGNVVPYPDGGSGSSGAAYATASSGGGLAASSSGGDVSASSSSGAGDDAGGSLGTDSGDDGANAPGADSGEDAFAWPEASSLEASTDDGGGAGLDATPTDMDVLPPPVDASPSPADAPASDGLSCHNLGCFDVFDCAIYHPAEFGPCGFTQCVNLVCQ